MILFEEAIWLESEKGGDWRGGEGGGGKFELNGFSQYFTKF